MANPYYNQCMVEFSGISSSPGYAIGKAFIYRHDKLVISHNFISSDEVDAEIARLEECFYSLIKEFRTYLENAIGDSEKALYTVELLMLEDVEYHKSIKTLILNKRYSAPWAVEEATEEIIKMISGVEDEYLKERIIDIRDIEYAVLETLTGKRREHIEVKDKRILVADYILTSELLGLEGLENILGIVLDTGGKTSHVSILAKSKKIPSVVGANGFSLSLEEGETVIVDGQNGIAIANPTSRKKAEYEKRKRELEQSLETYGGNADAKGCTKDGKRIILDANIEWLEGVDDAISSGAENIGLFRTEFIAIKNDILNSRDKKDEIYMDAALKMSGHGDVVFRTLDIGGDKKTDGMIAEENPILGWRAVRYMLSHRKDFKAQMRAVLMASRYHNVRMMFPMVSGIEELDETLDLLDEVKRELRKEKVDFDEEMKIGTMIEVPSAALISDVLAKKVDFFSIGTNDLIQYTIAVDRGNDKTNYLYNPLHLGVLRLMKLIVDNAHDAGIEVGLCGQMASEKLYLPILVGLGLDELSMSPASLPEIRRYLSSLSYGDCSSLVNEVLSETNPDVIEKKVKEFLNERETRN